MKKIFKNCVTALICYILLSSAIVCFAMDEAGCLTCHKYPGLVIYETPQKFKALHIDEGKYISSVHGEFGCKECHTHIVKVPHTNETEVDCTTECHPDDKEEALIKSAPLSSFHKEEQSYITGLKDRSSCGVCHTLYAHSKNNTVRAFLNLHTGFVRCEVCHIKRDKFMSLSYDWTDTDNVVFHGEPFGTYYNPKIGKASKSKNSISRITAFDIHKGEKQLVVNTSDIERAKEFIRTEKNFTLDEKAKELEYFHKDIKKREISVACNECHSENSILDYMKLGFDDKKRKDLIYLNIKGLVTKYRIFYFPNLFGQ